MKQILKPFAALALLLLTYGFAAAQNDPPTRENTGEARPVTRDPAGHWTEQALARAQLKELPTGERSFEEAVETDSETRQALMAKPSVLDNGRSPIESAEVAPNRKDLLFDRPPVSEVAPPPEFQDEASGSSIFGAFFSSSRLVPTDARLEYPYRVNGKIFFSIPGEGDFICSGVVIEPRLVLTAGHCVHGGANGSDGLFDNFLFVPAYHQGEAPFQAWNWRWVTTTPSWASSNGIVPNRADFAIIEVEDRQFGSETKRVGDVVGWLGFRTEALNPNHTKKIGFPGNHDDGEIMHQVDSGWAADADNETVLYGSDMRGGSSGGAWIENFGVKAQGQTGALSDLPNRVVGITSYGFRDTDPKVQGSSILNDEFLQILNLACAHREGNCD